MKLAPLWLAALFACGELYESALPARVFPAGICSPEPGVHFASANEEQQAILDEIVAAARTQQASDDGGGTVVVMFAGSTYRRVVINWWYSATASNVKNILIVSLDAELHRLLQTFGAPSFYHAAAVETLSSVVLVNRTADVKHLMLAKVWGYRIMVIEALLKAGMNVLQTDSDVVLYPNAVAKISELPGDLVVQPGGMPTSVASQWGAALCLGLTLFRSNERTLQLFRMARAFFVHAECDDQIAFNYALKACTQMVFKSKAWDSSGPLLFGKRVKTTLKTEAVYGHARKSPNDALNGKMTVTFMPAMLAPRREGPCRLASGVKGLNDEQRLARIDAALAETPNSVAFHCNSATGKSDQTTKRLKVSGLYYVSDRAIWTFNEKIRSKQVDVIHNGSAAEAKQLIMCLGNGRHPGHPGWSVPPESCTKT